MTWHVLTLHVQTWPVLIWPVLTLPILTWHILTWPIPSSKVLTYQITIHTSHRYPPDTLKTHYTTGTFQTPLIHPSDSQRTPTRHPQDTCQRPARHPPDTHKTVTKVRTCRGIPSARSKVRFLLLPSVWKQSQLLFQPTEIELFLKLNWSLTKT